MNQDKLIHELELLVRRLKQDGDLLWKRTADWVRAEVPKQGERGGGSSAPNDEALDDRRADRQASRYHDEVRALEISLIRDAARLRAIAEIVNPPPHITLKNGQLQLAQVAAEGWCVSCWRNNKTCNPIAIRSNGQPYYKDRCRPCGEWRHEYGQDPPMSILTKRHNGQRITTKDLENALKR